MHLTTYRLESRHVRFVDEGVAVLVGGQHVILGDRDGEDTTSCRLHFEGRPVNKWRLLEGLVRSRYVSVLFERDSVDGPITEAHFRPDRS